jgi:hypothetical protein
LASNQLAGLHFPFKFRDIYTDQTDLIDKLGGNKALNKCKKKGILRFATSNVRGISFKEDQLDNILAKKGIKIAAISETKNKLKGSKETNNYIQLFYDVSRTETAQAGVMLMINISLNLP